MTEVNINKRRSISAAEYANPLNLPHVRKALVADVSSVKGANVQERDIVFGVGADLDSGSHYMWARHSFVDERAEASS